VLYKLFGIKSDKNIPLETTLVFGVKYNLKICMRPQHSMITTFLLVLSAGTNN